ncbi:hypothetical protein [Nostoc sp. CCY0012]|uniref:hypothetical protein n=1 Tax=Nostoc sp. CCY0012 TaxID=1056123 RepID=UPI0039C750E7
MTFHLTCPVCDRQEIAGDICPNCETDLSVVRMLVELPKEKPTNSLSLLMVTTIVCLSLGFAAAFMFRFFAA